MSDIEKTISGRVGLFGGTFNPLHVGHLNIITSVGARMNLERLVVIPAARNPNKAPVEGPTDEQRLEMLRRGLEEHGDFVTIDTRELERGGASYAIDTVREYSRDVAPENLYLIVGLDQFEDFDKWKEFSSILELCNLVVISRPRHNPPFSEDDLPAGLKPLVAVFDRSYIALHSGRSIEFLRLKEFDVSSTDVRKTLRTGRNADAQITIPVEEYIREQGLYAPIGPLIGDYRVFTEFCAGVLFGKKAIGVRAFDLTETQAATEYTLIASGTSTRHASSLADAVQRAVKEEFNVFPMSIEGSQEGRWVLLDYGSLIVHIFYDFVRQEYGLENLWKTGKDLELQDPGTKAAAPNTH
jgi:nicotinate-nucleotide adenylyltransferase